MATSQYVKVNWTPRVTPLTAYNFKKMDEGIYLNNSAVRTLETLLDGGSAVNYDRIFAIKKNQTSPSWYNFIDFMAQYAYQGDLE